MLANTITLPVDVLNNDTTVDSVFTRDLEEFNKTTYRGPTHTLTSRDILQFYRTLNKRVGNSFGVVRTSQKRTKDFLVTAPDGTSVSQAAIIEVSSAFPPGLTAAQTLVLRQELVALLDHALMASVHNNAEV